MVQIRRVNLEEPGTMVETLRYSPVNLVGQDSTKKCVQYNFKFAPVYSDSPWFSSPELYVIKREEKVLKINLLLFLNILKFQKLLGVKQNPS